MTNSRPINARPIHRMFEEQAARVPNNPAVLWGGERVSYAELNSAAERVADTLRGHGVTPGSTVGLEMDRCRELIPCLLGIFKAGCAYVPLLPDLPEQRRAFMVKDSGAVCKIIKKQNARGKKQESAESIADKIEIRFSGEQILSSGSSLLPPAYVLYTSGSTGMPKGVKITQDALCNRLMWQQAHFGLTEGDTLLQKTSLGFDVSLWELFWAFTVGASLRVPEPGAEKDPRRLMQIIVQDNIRIVHFVPSMLTEFLEAYAAAGRPKLPLSKVIVSGEALTPALNRRFYKLFGGSAALHNLYGPTECTVDVLYYDCKPDDEEIPIGKAVWNTGTHILDADGHEVPCGAQGELCISGAQLAAGYADPALDEGRFVKHPELGRIYHTGDMASERADGEILCRGRRDGQVKIRGQRVELGEIESALGSLAEIRQAAVLWDGARLSAYFLSALPLRGEYLREQLAKTLPGYMLPDSFTRLDAFPLNPSGKLDRHALTELDGDTRTSSSVRVGKMLLPQSPSEHALASILTGHFGKTNVSMRDSPAALGLDSLEMVRLATLLGEQGIVVAINDFFTAPNLRALVGLARTGDAPILLQLAGGEPRGGELTAYVGVPYGGGGFGVYAAAAAELCGTSGTGGAFYAVRSAHVDPAELLAAADALHSTRVVLLGSCAGTAAALTLAARLEQAGMPAAGVFLIASAPAKYKNSPWRFFGDRAINRYLSKLNGQSFKLAKHEIQSFRADTDYFFEWQKQPESPAHTPIYLLTGDADPMLSKMNPRADWERLLGREVCARSVPGGMHYLPHTHAELLARWILDAEC